MRRLPGFRAAVLPGGPTGRLVLRAALLSVFGVLAPAHLLSAQCPDGTAPPCGSAAAPRVAAPRAVPAANSVAVLYFDNLSRDSSDAVLTDGLTEEIINRLGDVERLTVKSRFAVRRFRAATELVPATIGRQLGVAYFVTGSLQRSGTRLRVRAELARAATGDRVWGQQYDRADGDIFDILTDIAQHVTSGVVGSLLPAERAALGTRPTENHGAMDHLLRGDALLARRTPASVRQSIGEYEAATQLDRALSQAWARMSVAYGVLVQRGWTPDGRPAPDSLSARGIAAADRALALDTASSDGWMALAYARMLRDPLGWQGAEEGLSRAVAIDRRNAEAWHQLGDLLGAMERRADAESAYRAAIAAEPGRHVTMLSLAGALPPREAIAVCDTVLAADPAASNAYVFRALSRLRLGDTTGARADRAGLERVVPVGFEIGTRALAARLTLAIGDTSEARSRALGLAAALPATGPIHPRIAGLLSGVLYDVGEHDRALDLLTRASRGVGTWQNRGNAAWLGDERFRAVFEASRPPWAR